MTMNKEINNLIFEGGGILGISYLGVLDYLSAHHMMEQVKRVGGTSAGAITACITSFHLPFQKMKEIAESLDYSKIPSKTEANSIDLLPEEVKNVMEEWFGDIHCLYRLINQYGWYSTEYFYKWIKEEIAKQFDPARKKPPYTFADFKNPSLHKNQQEFYDLYIIGTNLSMKNANVFSYETTPMMEVAEAVRISMSIPLFFEAVITDDAKTTGSTNKNVLCDGGAMNNYPLNLFDSPRYNPHLYYGKNMNTLGARFQSILTHSDINNLLDYIESLLHLSSYIQQEIYESNPLNQERSIIIPTGNVSALDFNIKPNDETFRYLYHQGYEATKNYFTK